MKSTLIVVVLTALAGYHFSDAAPQRGGGGLVPAEFRNINIESYLKNPRSVLFQLKCIVYDGPCDRIGKYLKVTIPELITGTCQHCSPSDRQTAGRLVSHIQKNYPKEWHDAIKKYQGGQVVKPDDALKFEATLGIKLDSDLVASTVAPTPAPTPVPSSVAPTVVLPPVQPASASVAPVSQAVPVVPVANPNPEVPVSSPVGAPVQPVQAQAPVAPIAPVAQVAPVSPLVAVSPVAPVVAVQPVESVVPTENTNTMSEIKI